MKLNKEQAKHLADTLRIVAIAQFGFFGYHGLVNYDLLQVAWACGAFVGFEVLALMVLEED